MSTTTAVPLEVLARASGDLTGQPMCPRCHGYLHPYKVEISLGMGNVPALGFQGVGSLVGWVAVCVGNRDYIRYYNKAHPDEPYDGDEVEPCGLSVTMEPR